MTYDASLPSLEKWKHPASERLSEPRPGHVRAGAANGIAMNQSPSCEAKRHPFGEGGYWGGRQRKRESVSPLSLTMGVKFKKGRARPCGRK